MKITQQLAHKLKWQWRLRHPDPTVEEADRQSFGGKRINFKTKGRKKRSLFKKKR